MLHKSYNVFFCTFFLLLHLTVLSFHLVHSTLSDLLAPSRVFQAHSHHRALAALTRKLSPCTPKPTWISPLPLSCLSRGHLFSEAFTGTLVTISVLPIPNHPWLSNFPFLLYFSSKYITLPNELYNLLVLFNV